MGKEKETKPVYILTYLRVNPKNSDSDLWFPTTIVKVYDDYYKAIGHLTESFMDTLERYNKEAYYGDKEKPKFEQKCSNAIIRYDGVYESWDISEQEAK
jgi:hypothetical protein